MIFLKNSLIYKHIFYLLLNFGLDLLKCFFGPAAGFPCDLERLTNDFLGGGLAAVPVAFLAVSE